jgi:hypothetical protein
MASEFESDNHAMFSCKRRLLSTGKNPKDKNKQTPWALVRERTIPTERPPLAGEIECQLLWIEGSRVVSATDTLRSLISVF